MEHSPEDDADFLFPQQEVKAKEARPTANGSPAGAGSTGQTKVKSPVQKEKSPTTVKPNKSDQSTEK